MNVLLTCEDYLPSIGGAEMCVFNLRRELKRLGHAVTIFTNTVQKTADESEIVRLPWRFTPSGFLSNVCILWRLIGQAGIVHCQYSFRIAAIAAVIARLRGKPMLLTQQGKGIVPEVHPKLFDALLVKLCQHVSMRLATKLTATSDEIFDLTTAFVPRSKIVLVSNGYDARQFSPDPSLPVPPEMAAIDSKITKILSVRRLVPKNGIHIFVQALALVKKKNPTFHYFAIGEGRVRAFLEQLIAELGLRHHVTLLGGRSNDAIKPYYQHADLVVIPSSAEARSIACIEAMGMGKPIIASQVGGLIDLIGRENRHGQLIDIYHDEACNYEAPERLPREQLQPLADAILAFMNDPNHLREAAKRAKAYVEKECSWEVITRQYTGLYEKIVKKLTSASSVL